MVYGMFAFVCYKYNHRSLTCTSCCRCAALHPFTRSTQWVYYDSKLLQGLIAVTDGQRRSGGGLLPYDISTLVTEFYVWQSTATSSTHFHRLPTSACFSLIVDFIDLLNINLSTKNNFQTRTNTGGQNHYISRRRFGRFYILLFFAQYTLWQGHIMHAKCA